MTFRCDVTIVGGGLAGTPLAVALSRCGFRVALVEAEPPAAFDATADYELRVSAISAASRRLFDRLGIWPAIAAARTSPYREMHVWDAEGAGLLHFDCADLGLPELGHIIENRLIQSAAWSAVGEGVEKFCPATLATLETGAAAARVTLADGRIIESPLVIGADGGESRVRTLAGIETRGWRYDQQGIVCNISTKKPHAATAWQRFLPTGPLAFLPLADGRCSIVWSCTSDDAARLLALDDAEFAERLGAASGHHLGRIENVGRRAAFPLRLQHAATYVKPRLALIGDAAHVIHPLAGQGINLGLLDVAALTDVLAEARRQDRDLGDLRVLQRYERWRRADNLAMMAVTDGLKRLYGSRNPLLKLLRNRGMTAVNSLTPLKNLLIRHAMGVQGDLPPLVRAKSSLIQ